MLTFLGGMTSTTQESFTTLLGAKKSQMTRPRTSNQLQNWQLPKTSPDSTTRYQEDQKQLNGKNVTLPTLDSCPAAVLNQANNQSEKSNFKFTREFQNHKFYKPVTIAWLSTDIVPFSFFILVVFIRFIQISCSTCFYQTCFFIWSLKNSNSKK